MSLLDEDFDVSVEYLIVNSVRKFLKNEDNRSMFYFSGLGFSFKCDPDRINIMVESIEDSESGEYFIGYDYLRIGDKERVKIKLFDVKYLVPQPHRIIMFEDLRKRSGQWRPGWWYNEPYYISKSHQGKIGNYSILSTMEGWAIYDLSQIINNLSTPLATDFYGPARRRR